MLLAGLSPVGVIGEIVADDGEMMRLPGLIELGEREGLPVTTVAALIEWMNEWHTGHDLGGGHGRGRCPSPRAWRSRSRPRCRPSTACSACAPTATAATGADHVAIIAGDPARDPAGAVVRVHSECLTGEAFGSLKCECGPQLDAALDDDPGPRRRRRLPARPRGPRHRAHQQAPRLPPAGGRPRHARREPRARPARSTPATTARPPAILADLGIDTRAPAHQQPREGAPARGARHPRRRAAAARGRRRRRQRGLPRHQASTAWATRSTTSS